MSAIQDTKSAFELQQSNNNKTLLEQTLTHALSITLAKAS